MNRAINPDTGKYERIPILDMGPYLAGVSGAREQLASEIQHVQENIGFSIFINHGVDVDLLDGAYAAFKKFFALPLEEKLKFTIDDTSLGYMPIRSTVYVTSVINKNTKKDLNETLTMAPRRSWNAGASPAPIDGRTSTASGTPSSPIRKPLRPWAITCCRCTRWPSTNLPIFSIPFLPIPSCGAAMLIIPR